MIDFECPNCGQELSAENSDRGNVFPCPQCGENIQVPNVLKLPEKKRRVAIRSSSQRECPFCGQLIQKSATKCRYCGEWLTGKNRAPRSFADEYGSKQMKQKVEKPGSVKFAVFLSFAQLALGLVFAWTDPNFRASFSTLGENSSTVMLIQGITAFIAFLFILGLNAGMNWIRWLYLIFTPIYLVLFVIGLLMMLPIIPPVWQIGSAVISAVVFVNLASDSAGRWYRAVANGQNR